MLKDVLSVITQITSNYCPQRLEIGWLTNYWSSSGSFIPFLLLAEDWSESYLVNNICPSVKNYIGGSRMFTCVYLSRPSEWIWEKRPISLGLGGRSCMAGESRAVRSGPPLRPHRGAHLALGALCLLSCCQEAAVLHHKPAPYMLAMDAPHPTQKQQSVNSQYQFFSLSSLAEGVFWTPFLWKPRHQSPEIQILQ